jgi:hypothetical protein
MPGRASALGDWLAWCDQTASCPYEAHKPNQRDHHLLWNSKTVIVKRRVDVPKVFVAVMVIG